MEDWQQWQLRADQIAADLGRELDVLDQEFFSESGDQSFRRFWPRFRDLKERVRTAPAIRLEAKLDLEKRLRGIGARAYKAQEAAFAQSDERKGELLQMIEGFRAAAEKMTSPRELRTLRRDLDRVREQFDTGVPLSPADRQKLWDAWRDTSQFVWKRLTGLWQENEVGLRAILEEGRKQLEQQNPNGARRSVARFFESLRVREAQQDAVVAMKNEAEAIRTEADQVEEKRATAAVTTTATTVPPLESWRLELDRNQETMKRLTDDVAGLEREIRQSTSILDQAMIRGTLVDKKRKLTELERANRTLEQRIEQSEDSPSGLMSAR